MSVFTSLVSLGSISRRSVQVADTFLKRIFLAAFLAFANWLPSHNGLNQLYVCNLSAKEYHLAIGIFTTVGSVTTHPIIVFIWAFLHIQCLCFNGSAFALHDTPECIKTIIFLFYFQILTSISQYLLVAHFPHGFRTFSFQDPQQLFHSFYQISLL